LGAALCLLQKVRDVDDGAGSQALDYAEKLLDVCQPRAAGRLVPDQDARVGHRVRRYSFAPDC